MHPYEGKITMSYMLFEKIDQIKIKIRQIVTDMQKLKEENETLKTQLREVEQILKQKEIEIGKNKKNIQVFSAIERENKQFKTDREILQKSVNEMIKELEDF